jgi:hypothetical protein
MTPSALMFRVIAWIIGLGGFAAIYVLANFYPAFPKSTLGWLAVFFIAFPVLMGLEFLGDVIFGARYWARRSSAARISLGVLVTLGLKAVTAPVLVFIARLINS